MALLTSELRRCKYELGYNLEGVGAEPYIGIYAIFEQVVATYLTAGASTTCATTVAAATTATPVGLTLSSATGFSLHDTVVVDVDDRQESARVTDVTGSVITLSLALAHTGTYPVTVEGGEAIVRSILRTLRNVEKQLERAGSSAGVKVADDVEFFPSAPGSSLSRLGELQRLREYHRSELASALGVQMGPGRKRGGGGGGTVSLY